MKVNDIVEANYWKADKTYRQKRLPGLEPDPVDNADRFDASTHDQADDHNPEIDVNNAQMRAAITQLLLKLSPRMERMLRERFFQGLTLEQISQKYGISRERIRQIEAKALRILKHPSRSKQLKSMLQTSTSEAANPAQQAAIAISMKKAGKKPKKETDEAKQRLDPKCWTGYHKAGTKMKGGIRVNNCVKDESVGEARKPKPDMSRRNFLRGAGAAAATGAAGYGIYKADEYIEAQEQKFLSQITDPADIEAYTKLKAERDSYPSYDYRTTNVGGKSSTTSTINPMFSYYDLKLDMLKGKLKKKYGIMESSGHIPKNSKEADDPRWSNALTVDIGPGEDKKQAAKLGFKVSNSGPPKMRADGKV
jgi:hypothetical protein